MNNLNIIAKFTENNKQYVMVLKNDNKILWGFIENGQVNSHLTKLEVDLFKTIVNALKTDEKNTILIGQEIVNSHNYPICLDSKKDIFTWPNYNILEDNAYLNFKYNNQPDILYLGMLENNNSNFIKRFIKKHHKLILVSFSTTILLTQIVYFTHIYNRVAQEYLTKENIISNESQEEVIVDLEDNTTLIDSYEDYDYNLITEAISNNSNLSEEEKDLLLNLQFVFAENYRYMDLDLITKRMANLKTIFTPESSNPLGIAGTYTRTTNEIVCYNTNDFSEAPINTYLHEFFHSLQSYKSHYHFYEFSNHVFTNETLRRLAKLGIIEDKVYESYLGTYGNYSPYFNYLAELLPKEIIKEYQFTNSPDSIINYLAKTDNEITKMYEVFQLIDDDFTTGIKDASREETLNNHLEFQEQVKNNLNEFYLHYKGHSINDDLNIYLWEHTIIESKEKAFDFFLEKLGLTDLLPYKDYLYFMKQEKYKTYFSNEQPYNIINLKLETLIDLKNSPIEFQELMQKYANIWQEEIVIDEEIIEEYATFEAFLLTEKETR